MQKNGLIPDNDYTYEASSDKMGSRGKRAVCRFLGFVSVMGNSTTTTCLILTKGGEQKLVSPNALSNGGVG